MGDSLDQPSAPNNAFGAEAQPPRRAVPPASGAVGSCPACGGPLYGWTEAAAADARVDASYVLDRCERCGLGLVHDGSVGLEGLLAIATANDHGLLDLVVPNRRSLQATVGEGRWAALRLPEFEFVATPRAITELLQRAGYQVTSLRQPVFGRNQLWMWQTLMNGLTLHRNFARELLAGRLTPLGARSRIAYAIDITVSILAAPLVALVSIPAETLAALFRRGGALVATVAPQVS